jgi:hypothetical protein
MHCFGNYVSKLTNVSKTQNGKGAIIIRDSQASSISNLKEN